MSGTEKKTGGKLAVSNVIGVGSSGKPDNAKTSGSIGVAHDTYISIDPKTGLGTLKIPVAQLFADEGGSAAFRLDLSCSSAAPALNILTAGSSILSLPPLPHRRGSRHANDPL